MPTKLRQRRIRQYCWSAYGFALLLLVASFDGPPAAHAQALPRARPEDMGFSIAGVDSIARTLDTSYVTSGRLPGFVAVIARHGRLVYSESRGFADLEQGRPLRADALFRIYSMTKPVTSLAIMQLAERGRLSLSDPVDKYIPSFRNVKVRRGGTGTEPETEEAHGPITIGQLLTHTSGLTYGGGTQRILNESATIEQFAENLAALPLAFQPGSGWSYGVGTDLLGRVVEVASGKPFDVYLQEEIFLPLQMRDTRFTAGPELESRMPRVYSRGADGRLIAEAQLRTRLYRSESRLYAGGQGLLSTVQDYLRFCQMLLNGGELDGRRVISREGVESMMTNHLPPDLSRTLNAFVSGWVQGSYGFGFGGAVRIDDDPAIPGARGTFRWAGHATTFFWVDPANDLAAMIWTQFTPSTSMVEFDNRFQRLVYAALIR